MTPDWLDLLDYVCVDIAFSCATAALCFRQHYKEKQRHDELLSIEATLGGNNQGADDWCTCGEQRKNHLHSTGQTVTKGGKLCVGFQAFLNGQSD